MEGTEATGGGQAGLNTVLPGQEACPISRDQRRACIATPGPCPSGGRKDEKLKQEVGLDGSWEESGKKGRVGLESKKGEKTSNAE